jgi:transcriptional regulator with XRE-family HTH domain
MLAAEHAGRIVKDVREAIGWTQTRLSRESGVSQPWISQIERGLARDVSVGTIDTLLTAMGARLMLAADAPMLAKSRQRDPVHTRCSAHVARRLGQAGWLVASEVEIASGKWRGWIDILAWHPTTGALLLIEVKTEINDLGQIERTLNWYEREAWAAATRRGWRPRRIVGCLLILSTEVVDQQTRDNREALDHGFPIRTPKLLELVDTGALSMSGKARGLALIDPRSHRRDWLRRTRLDGRRSSAPYVDYIDFLRRAA